MYEFLFHTTAYINKKKKKSILSIVMNLFHVYGDPI